MADTTLELNNGSGGGTLAVDDIAGAIYQYVGLTYGGSGSKTAVSNANPLPTKITDGTDTALVNGSGELMVVASGTVNLGATDNAVLDAIAASVAAADSDLTTIIGHVDGVEGLLTTIDTDTGNIATNAATIAGAVSGSEMQTDVLSVIPGTGATNLGKAKGSAVGATDTGVGAYARLRYTAAHSSGADGEWDTLDLTSWHELRTRDQRAVDLQNCNDYTDFTALSNDTSNLADSVNHVFGTGAVTFDKVNGAANTVFAGITATLASLNIEDIFEDGAFVGMAMYLPSLTNVDYAFIRLGTDGSNYNEWQWDSADLVASRWMSLRNPTAQPDTYAGNGWNSTDIDYLCVGVAFAAETNTLAGIIVDHIHFVGGRVTDTTLDATISSSVTTPNVNLHRVGGSPTDSGSGAASAGTQRVILATNQPVIPVSDNSGSLTVDDGGSSISIDDGGNVITVDGTVAVTGTVDLGATDNAVLDAIAASVAAIDTDATTIIGHVDGIEGLLTTIDGDTGTIATHAATLAGAVSGTEVQVDVLTMPTITVNSHAVTNAGTFAVQVDGSALTALQLIDDTVFTDDAAFTPGTSKGIATGFMVDSTATDSVDEGDFGVARMTADRAQITVASERSGTVYESDVSLAVKYASIDVSSSGDNTLVSSVSGKKIRVLSCFLVAAGTVNVRFESGAGGTALTGQMNLIANTGFVLPHNVHGWFQTADTTLLNLELSAAVSVDGSLTYIEAE